MGPVSEGQVVIIVLIIVIVMSLVSKQTVDGTLAPVQLLLSSKGKSKQTFFVCELDIERGIYS